MNRPRHVYGPVPSRRFGLSLGVDLVPYKVCCLDCVYCQLGATTRLTLTRELFVDPEEIAAEVRAALGRGVQPDVITLAGSGEPTLYSALGEVEAALHRVTRVPLCLLTNGTLFAQEEVAEAALGFDLVAPSLDAPDPDTFARLNRPAPGLSFEQALEGLEAFCRRYRGTLRLEIMLVRGYNDGPDAIAGLARIARSLDVDAVDLNTVVRPPTCGDARPLDGPALLRVREAFAGLRAEIIAPFAGAEGRERDRGDHPARGEPVLDRLVELVSRRPCTLEDLAAGLGLTREEAERAAAEASATGAVRADQRGGATYYLVARAARSRRKR